MDDPVRVAVRLSIRGRVQGVGYRDGMRAEALRLGLTGWVRNRADGSVEARAQGRPAAVDALIAWSRRGPPAARVDAIDVAPDAISTATTFERRPTV